MKEKFLDNINLILNEKNINGIELENLDCINEIFNNTKITDVLYNDFLLNYISEYGEDESFINLKVEDMIYGINLLIKNIIVDKFSIIDKLDINNAFENYLTKNNDGSLFIAYSYDENDLITVEDNFGYLKYDDLLGKLERCKDDRFKKIK